MASAFSSRSALLPDFTAGEDADIPSPDLSPASMVARRSRAGYRSGRRPGRVWVIEPNRLTVTAGVFSLGLLLPFGAGAFPDRAIATLMETAGQIPAKHVGFVQYLPRETIELRATGSDFAAGHGNTQQPDDRGAAGAVPIRVNGTPAFGGQPTGVTLVVDGVRRLVWTPQPTVAGVLAAEHLSLGPHDRVRPAPATTVGPADTIEVSRATSWLERVRSTIVPPIRHRYDVTMLQGTQRVVDPGRPGTKETTIAVLQPDRAVRPRRVSIAARILRLPRTKIVAEGVGDYSALGAIARRGILGTFRLADAALKMIATAYTAGCSGCSGLTASGRPAGHGIVAVDPRFIPLGTHLYIPGYGHAYAGDTGGSIRGNRIDLGFDTHRDALSFGRRAIVVYIVK